MLGLLRHDIKRILLSPCFWITVLLFFGLGVLQQFTSIQGSPFSIPKKRIEHIGALNRYLLSVCSPNKETVEFSLPIIMMLPCGTLFLSEYKSRYIRHIFVRSGKYRYIASKIIISLIMGMLTVAFGEILLLLFNTAIDPHISKAILEPYADNGIISGIYFSSIPKFSLLQSLNLILFGGAYSVLALGFSALWNNKYLTYTTGFLYANIILQELKKIIDTPYATCCAKLWYLDMFQTPYGDVLNQYGCIFAFGAILFALCVLRRCSSDV